MNAASMCEGALRFTPKTAISLGYCMTCPFLKMFPQIDIENERQ